MNKIYPNISSHSMGIREALEKGKETFQTTGTVPVDSCHNACGPVLTHLVSLSRELGRELQESNYSPGSATN